MTKPVTITGRPVGTAKLQRLGDGTLLRFQIELRDGDRSVEAPVLYSELDAVLVAGRLTQGCTVTATGMPLHNAEGWPYLEASSVVVDGGGGEPVPLRVPPQPGRAHRRFADRRARCPKRRPWGSQRRGGRVRRGA